MLETPVFLIRAYILWLFLFLGAGFGTSISLHAENSDSLESSLQDCERALSPSPSDIKINWPAVFRPTRIHVRQPGGRQAADWQFQIYLLNAKHAAVEFGKSFENLESISFQTFTDQFRLTHVHMVQGTQSRPVYGGYMQTYHDGYSHTPGEFFLETRKTLEGRVDATLRRVRQSQTRLTIKSYTSALRTNLDKMNLGHLVPTGNGSDNEVKLEVSLYGLEQKFYSHCYVDISIKPEARFYFNYAPFSSQDLALQKMYELTEEIRAHLRSSDGDKATIVRKIAYYYHLGINNHFFPRVNNSVLMTHVNVMLKMAGFDPIPHEYWDYVAMVVGHEEFAQLFVKRVLGKLKTSAINS